MNKFSAEFSGGEEIRQQLQQLSDKVSKRGMANALRKAAQLVKEAAVNKVILHDQASTPTKIHQNIAVRATSAKRLRGLGGNTESSVGISIGVLGGAMSYAGNKSNQQKGLAGMMYPTLGSSDNPGGDTWYWRFLELGTKHAPAKPFLRPAFDNQSSQLLDTIVAELNNEIAKALK
jgi:HK97 gp10 family phage protein